MVVYCTGLMRALFYFMVGMACPLFFGCAARQEWIYERRSATPAQLDHDMTTCRRMAPSHSVLKIFMEEKVDRGLFNQCMEKRGYTVRVEKLQ